jgi:hypothetical protein
MTRKNMTNEIVGEYDGIDSVGRIAEGHVRIAENGRWVWELYGIIEMWETGMGSGPSAH